MGDWVEIREAVSAPKKATSKAKIKVKNHKVYNYIKDIYEMSGTSKVIETQIFVGGTVLGCLKLNDFFKMTKMIPNKGELMEIPKNFVDKLKEVVL